MPPPTNNHNYSTVVELRPGSRDADRRHSMAVEREGRKYPEQRDVSRKLFFVVTV